jgi:CheY-like chemotaxis protein
VESEPGTGSVFHVFLPASLKKVQQQPAVSGKSIKKGFGTILLMDDEEVVRASTGGLLKQFGYDVVFAKNGEQALQMLAESAAHGSPMRAAILDLTICGGMGGRETISLIRAQGIDLPVIVSSGYADDPILANPAHYGFTGSIKKPFTYEELGILLETVLAQV